MQDEQSKLIQALRFAVNDLVEHPTTEDDMPDVAGSIRYSETRLAGVRRNILAEAPYFQKGELYQIVTSRPNERSYNEPGIFTVTQEIGVSILDLVNAGALKFTWQWTKLEKFFYDHDLELRIVQHELSDEEKVPEGPHVGVVKSKPKYAVEAIPADEMEVI